MWRSTECAEQYEPEEAVIPLATDGQAIGNGSVIGKATG